MDYLFNKEKNLYKRNVKTNAVFTNGSRDIRTKAGFLFIKQMAAMIITETI